MSLIVRCPKCGHTQDAVLISRGAGSECYYGAPGPCPNCAREEERDEDLWLDERTNDEATKE